MKGSNVQENNGGTIPLKTLAENYGAQTSLSLLRLSSLNVPGD